MSTAEVMDRYSRFPDIFQTDAVAGAEIEWRIPIKNISSEKIVSSWAALLCAFTGNEHAVFSLDGVPVRADPEREGYVEVRLIPAPEDGGWNTYTAVVTRNVLQNHDARCALMLQLDLGSGTGTLRSETGIPVESLDQIGRQLKQLIRKRYRLHSSGLQEEENDGPLLSISNPNPKILPGPQLLHHCVFHPDRNSNTAIEFLDKDGTIQRYTYDELDSLSTALACQILTVLSPLLPISPARVVPVLLPQSVELYISWLAILKAGGGFCPIGIDSPSDRVAFIIEDVAAQVVITISKFKDKVADNNSVSLLLVDNLNLQAGPLTTELPSVSANNLAYVMYTSGSTGRPKGVRISHTAVTQSLLAHDKLIPSFRRFLQFASPTFDVSVFEVFFPWLRGATLVGCERSEMLRDLPGVITKMNVDAAELTPTVAGELLRSREAAPSLRVLLTIGEMLTKRVVEEFGSTAERDGILHGMYGPTEAAIHCTAAPHFQANSGVHLIGRPLATVSAFVIAPEIDPDTKEPEIRPIGQIGELAVGGPQLAIDYINRPAENSKAFLHTSRYGRLYRTGDKARFLPNGDIECLGRILSGQVKLRGQRVELGEIESVICHVHNVRAAVASVVNGILVVWVLVDTDAISTDEIRQACKKRLPTFMVPGDFVLVREFPRLASGKVDKKTLESDYISRQKINSVPKPAYRDALEEKIAWAVQQSLNVLVPNDASLAAAGLDSLSGIRLASRLREIGINIDVAKLLAADSVQGIWHLARSDENLLSGGPYESLAITWDTVVEAGFKTLRSMNLDSAVDSVEPCSNVQTAMLAETCKDPRAYCNWIELRFDEHINLQQVHKAFQQLMQRHSILRSGFLNIGLPDHTFCRFIWKTIRDGCLKETDRFDYGFPSDTESIMLTPLNVQIKFADGAVHALVQLHHALYDGWSWELILDDLQSFIANSRLPERPPFSNIVKYDAKVNSVKATEDSVSYWTDTLRDLIPPSWPIFHDRTDIPRAIGFQDRDLGVPLSELDGRARSLSVSRQTLFQAAFAYLLSSYLDTPDAIFGTVFSGRTMPIDGIESIIGPCLRVLPTRLNLAWMQTVTDLLVATHSSNRKALEFGDLPLREIKKASGIRATDSLFDSLVVWQETPWTARTTRQFKETAAADFLEYSLTLQFEPRETTVSVRAIYDESIFPASQVRMLLEQIDAVSALFVRSPDILIRDINGKLPERVLSIENSNFQHLTDLPSLSHRVERLATEDPQRKAIEFLHSLDPETGQADTESVTYSELNRRANNLAHRLIELGVGGGDLVAIILDKSPSLYIAILSVIKIGAGYVPLALETPVDRMRFVLMETKPTVCIVESQLRTSIESLDWLKIITSDELETEKGHAANISAPHSGSNLAYVVFTSGSTGKPKGVLISHDNLKSNIAVLTELYPIGNDAKLLQACSQAFDVSVFEIFFTWHNGMTLCSATNDIMFRDIELVIRDMEVTHLSLTPTVAALISPSNVPRVRFLVTAGEGLTSKVHKDWAGRGLYQGYGPSETTNICTVRPNVEPFDVIRNIGKPFKNTSAFVVSDGPEFSILPRGSVGEFCFGGDQVGQGYLSMPALTEEKFIDHPKYGRLYRSGDFGRLLSNGTLTFTGRRDTQVKLRGQRVELGEINSVLLGHSSVKDCTTMILGDSERGQQQLVSFWVPAAPFQEITRDLDIHSVIDTLFEKLTASLPNYMIPSALIPIPEIPMTTVKKIDERKLKHMFTMMKSDELQRFSRLQGAATERELTNSERVVAEIVSELTQIPLKDIRANTSIYSLGIDSISAIQLSKRFRESGHGHIDVSIILKKGSIAELAKAIGTAHTPSDATDSSSIRLSLKKPIIEEVAAQFENRGHDVQSIVPCTPLQEAMLARTASNVDAYCNHVLLEVYGDTQKLRDIWGLMVQKHEILRTCFCATTDTEFPWVQAILKSITLPWTTIQTTMDNLAAEIEQQKLRFAETARNPYVVPYSVTVLESSAGNSESMLLLSIHHALHDAEGLTQLLRETENLYMGRPLTQSTQFRKFIDFMSSIDGHQAKNFWTRYLEGLSPTRLCTAVLKGPLARPRRQRYWEKLSITLREFETMCRNISVSTLNVFHAAWSRLLFIYTGSTDVCFGNVFSGRTIPLDGIEGVIGPCFNTLPVRMQIRRTAVNLDLMRSAQRSNAEIMPYQLSSLRQIQKDASADGASLFDTLILLQSPPSELDKKLWRLVSEEGDMDFPLIIEIIPNTKDDSLSICIHSDNLHVSASDSTRIARQMADLVIQTIRYPSASALDRTIANNKLPTIAEAARKQRGNKVSGNLSDGANKDYETLSKDELRVIDHLSRLSGHKHDVIRPDTTIFQLGLDSINAVQLSNLLRQSGFTVSAADILEGPSVREIAMLLPQSSSDNKEEKFDFKSFDMKHRKSVCAQIGIASRDINAVRPCTPVQSGMLALYTKSNGYLYCNRTVVRTRTASQLERLQDAWSMAMTRHEMLRTGFVHLRDQGLSFAMITYKEQSIPLPWVIADNRESVESEIIRRRQDMFRNLHLPAWFVVVTVVESSIEIHFTAHHALFDAQSLNLILSDVVNLYHDGSLRPLVPNDRVLSHILTRAAQVDADTERFWTELGADFPVVKFPNLSPVNVDKPRLITSSKLSSERLESIEAQCQSLGVSLQAAGQAAWARLLSAYIGESDVSFGLVLSGRDMFPEAQEAAFPCLVTLPFQCRIEGNNHDLIFSIMRRNAQLGKRQFTPLSRIQRWFKTDNYLLDILFVYQKLPVKGKQEEFWEVVQEDSEVDYSVSIEIIPRTDRLEFRLTYRDDILPQAQAELVLEQFDAILWDSLWSPDSDCKNFDIPQGLLSITPAKEPYIQSSVRCLHEFVELSARKVPEKTALEFVSSVTSEGIDKETWNYRKLDNIGNQIARFIQSLNVPQGSLIGICFDKCPQASFAIVGILKAGCAYVALDPRAPIARKQFIVDDSSARIIFCVSEHVEELRSLSGVQAIALDKPGIYDNFECNPPALARQVEPSDTCYCLYTSGTTGTPKGCEITHENAVQAMQSFTRLFDGHWDEHSRWLQFASFHFDVSVLEQFWSWSAGICVTSCPRDLLFQDLSGTISKLQITHIDLTPSLARLLSPEEVPSLCKGVFITGGEQLKQEILDAWGDHEVIYNGYGPTEATIGVTMLPRLTKKSKPSNIGPQFDNVGSYVLKPGTATPVLRGAVGELCVSGALVGRGYLNRPKLTEERFPFLKDFQERVYKTGDLVRILHDGSFQFLGRIDDQVKLRGQRLEIGEINSVIHDASQEVGDVATLVVRHPAQARDQLVSFVTRRTTTKPRGPVEVLFSQENSEFLSAIKESVEAKLPSYMVPTHIIPASALPLSANNKVEVKALKEIYGKLSLDDLQTLNILSNRPEHLERKDVQRIIDAVSDFAGVDASAISPTTTIYELGLDSISVIGLAQTLRNAGYAAQVSLIMKSPTISGMARFLAYNQQEFLDAQYDDSKQRLEAFVHQYSAIIAAELGVSTTALEGVAPCTPIQEGMILRFLESSKSLYCSSFHFELNSDTDVSRLREAWKQTQQDVQILRARFVPYRDGYAQAILKHDDLVWDEVACEDEDTSRIMQDGFNTWCKDIHELAGPLWKLQLVKSPRRTILNLNIFHALYDGNSLPLLLERVAKRYTGDSFDHGGLTFLEILPIGPLRRINAAEKFWTGQLAELTEHNTIFPESDSAGSEPLLQIDTINGIKEIEPVKTSLQVTEHSVFHACWLLTLHAHLSVVPALGIVVSGRALDVPGAEYVIGPLFNTIPSYIRPSSSQTVKDLIRACHQYHVDTLPFQHTSLRDIMKWTRRTSDRPLFEILFVYQKEPATSKPINDSIWTRIDSVADVDYPLSLEVQQNQDSSYAITLAAQSRAVNAEKLKAMAATFKDTLAGMLRDLSERLSIPDDPMRRQPHTDVRNYQDSSEPKGEITWTPDMLKLRSAIADLAGVSPDEIDAFTSILEMGLDSIDAIKLSSRLRDSGIQLTVSTIMNRRTILKMSQEISRITRAPKESGSSLGNIEKLLRSNLERHGKLPANAVRVLPATPLQESLVAEMANSGYKHYYNRDVLELRPGVDIGRLLRAWKTVIKAHPILRTSFKVIEDVNIPFTYAQVIHLPSEADSLVLDIQDCREEELLNPNKEDEVPDPNLPALKICAVRNGSRQAIILSIAHALYDGWSLNLVHEDVSKAYRGEEISRPPYDDVLEQIVSSPRESSQEFWSANLADVTPRSFPRRKVLCGNNLRIHRMEKDLDIGGANIGDFCRQHGVTAQALSVTTWALTLAGYLETLDVVFGLILSGRNFAGADEIMFPTMNTVAFRTLLHGSRADMLRYVQDSLGGIAEHQHYPLRRACLDAGARELFDTLFIYQKRPERKSSNEQPLYQSVGEFSDTGYPLSVEMELVNGSMICRLAARGDAFECNDAIGIVDRIQQVFRMIVNDPEQATVERSNGSIVVCGCAPFRDRSIETRQIGTRVGTNDGTALSPLEKSIRSVLSTASGVPEDQIYKQSTLFQLGLDSITAIKVSSLLNRQSIDLPVSTMLKARTLENMAAMARTVSRSQTIGADNVIEQLLEAIDVHAILLSRALDSERIERVLPATAGQTYLLATNLQDPDRFYPSFYYTGSDFDGSQLECAWKQLAKRLPILRTLFIPTGSRQLPFLQVILKETDNSVHWHASVEEMLQSGSRPTIESGPVALHATKTAAGIMIDLRIHHALYDAVSLPKMLSLLGQCITDRAPRVTGPSLADLVAFQTVQSPLQVREKFWKDYLGQSTYKAVPQKREACGQAQSCYRPALVRRIDQLDQVARSHSLSIQSLFFAIYAKVHARVISPRSGADGSTESLILGVYLANRSLSLEGLPDMIAPTLNMVPLRVQFPQSASVMNIARQIQNDLHEIGRVEHSGVSLVEIADWTGVRVDVFVNFIKLPDSGFETQPNVRFTPVNPNTLTVGRKQILESRDQEGYLADVYKVDCIDVEAAIREGGLDVGIFAPAGVLESSATEMALDEIRQELEILADGV